MTKHDLDDVGATAAKTHRALQTLTNLLEEKNILTGEELAVIYGEVKPDGQQYRRNLNQNLG